MNNNLDKIEQIKLIKNSEILKKKLEITTDQEFVEELIKILCSLLSQETKGKSIHKLINKCYKFIEDTINYGNDLNILLLIDKIVSLKEKQILKIKKVSKEKRIENEWVKFLKVIVNDLEKLEVNLIYNRFAKNRYVNSDIVDYILFKERNILHSLYLINKYPHIINIYDISSSGYILDILVNNFIVSLKKYQKTKLGKKDIFYYENIIEGLLSAKKIKISEESRTRNLKSLEEIIDEDDKYNKLWVEHIIKIIKSHSLYLEEKDIYYMYNCSKNNIIFIKPEKEIQEKNNDDFIITVDGDKTIDKDDGLSITKINDNYNLKVVIADPLYYFPYNSKVMMNAREYGESIYYENNVNSMFNKEFTTNYLSLDENKLRPSRIYNYEIDKYGNIVSFKIKKESIIVNNNLTYNQINNIIKTKTNDKNINNTIELLLELKNIITNKYNIIARDEKVKKESYTTGELLIMHYMVFNNYLVANYFKNNGYPFIYCSHILHKSLDGLYTKINNCTPGVLNEYLNVLEEIKKIDLSSFYSLKPLGHDGLNLTCYSRLTSPIRRYADILANICQDKYYFKSMDIEDKVLEKYLKESVEILNDRHFEIMEHYKKLERFR